MKETGWSMVCLITATLFIATCGLMSTLDSGGGPCGQGDIDRIPAALCAALRRACVCLGKEVGSDK